MILSKENLHKKMKVMKVEARAQVFPLISEEHCRYTTFLQVRFCILILPHHSPWLNNTQNTPHEDSEAAALYTAI